MEVNIGSWWDWNSYANSLATEWELDACFTSGMLNTTEMNVIVMAVRENSTDRAKVLMESTRSTNGKYQAQNLLISINGEGKNRQHRVAFIGSLSSIYSLSCFDLPTAPEVPLGYIRQLPLAVLA